MAKLPALVSALAEVDGRDRPTIDHIARVIREAGYIPTGKRGVGAKEMDVRSATNMLIALASAEAPKDIPTEIDRFRSLKLWHIQGESDEHRIDVSELLASLGEVKTFGEALEILVDSVPELLSSFIAYGIAEHPGESAKEIWDLLALENFGINIEFKQYSAEIEVFTTDGPEYIREFSAKYTADNTRKMAGFYGRKPRNRKVSISFNFMMLLAAWKSLFPENEIVGIADGDPS